jgi:hypothetical protein
MYFSNHALPRIWFSPQFSTELRMPHAPEQASAQFRLEVPSRVHALVQDPNHVYTVFSVDIKDQVTADAVATVPLSNIVTVLPPAGICRDSLDCCPDL